MFAGTVVVQRRRRFTRRAQLRRGFLLVWNVRAAEEILFVEFTFAKERGGGRDVHRLSAVGCARQRNLLRREVVLIDGAVLDQRERLKGLGRGAETGAMRGIAGEGEEPPLRVDDGDGAMMGGFDLGAAV